MVVCMREADCYNDTGDDDHGNAPTRCAATTMRGITGSTTTPAGHTNASMEQLCAVVLRSVITDAHFCLLYIFSTLFLLHSHWPTGDRGATSPKPGLVPGWSSGCRLVAKTLVSAPTWVFLRRARLDSRGSIPGAAEFFVAPDIVFFFGGGGGVSLLGCVSTAYPGRRPDIPFPDLCPWRPVSHLEARLSRVCLRPRRAQARVTPYSLRGALSRAEDSMELHSPSITRARPSVRSTIRFGDLSVQNSIACSKLSSKMLLRPSSLTTQPCAGFRGRTSYNLRP